MKKENRERKNFEMQPYIRLITIIIFIIVINTSIGLVYILRKNVNNINYKIGTIEGWNKYKSEPILGDNETGSVFDPNVIKDNEGIYRMYVSWRNTGGIAVSTSDDGVNWSNLKIVLMANKESGWENIVNRATVIYKDGKYIMYYTGQTENESRIGYAISEDGYNFERKKEPVLIPQENYEAQSVMNPYVMYDEDEKMYKMWYAAGEKYEPDVLCYATSIDGIEWNKYYNNPILKASDNKNTLDNFKVGACEVKKINKNEFLMFYIGYSDIHTARIFVAKSENGIDNWNRENTTPIIAPTKGEFDSEACYKPSAIWDNDRKKWLVYYNGRTDHKEYIGLYTFSKYEII